MYKNLVVVLIVSMLMMVGFGSVYSDEKATTKDKSATCTLHKDGKCPPDCCTDKKECKAKSTEGKKADSAKKSTCKESACKSTCPAHSNCKSIEGKKN